MQTSVTNERSSESAQADDTTSIFAIFQPLVNSSAHTDPKRLVSPAKGTWKERSWLGSAQVPSVKMLFSSGQARQGLEGLLLLSVWPKKSDE